MSFGKLFKRLFIPVITSFLSFFLGLSLGLIIVLWNKFFKMKFIPTEVPLVIWSLWNGLSAYSLIFNLNNADKPKFNHKESFYALVSGVGTYLALFLGDKPASANLFAGITILGLLLVLTAPPFIEKYLKHKFIQRAP
ncbi:MAG: hypothetical protein AAB784_02135 [Patescibacteria group bacterium]